VSLTGNNNTVLLGDGNDSVSLSGHNNTATLGNGNDTVTVSGTGNMVTAGSGNDVFNLGAGMTTLTMHGLHDQVSVNGGNDTIIDTPSGADKLQLNIGAQGGTVGITNFDVANAVVSLVQTLAGAEQWTSPAQIAAAVTSDGHSGSLLSLGSYGKINFVGVPTGQLTAHNFQIS
jgi:Ca2+-binding RTX toxin-like protein